MARMSLDQGSTSSSKAKAAQAAPAGDGKLDKAAKIKLGVAIAVIVLSALWIAYTQGWLGGDETPPPSDVTPEQAAEFEQTQRNEEEAIRSGRVAPRSSQ